MKFLKNLPLFLLGIAFFGWQHGWAAPQLQGPSQIQGKKIYQPTVYFLHGAEHLSIPNKYFDIPIAYNDAVAKWIEYFKTRGREGFIRYIERAGRYAPILGKILEERKLPRDLVFVAMAESGFHNNAESGAGAVGTWQFMLSTAEDYLMINWFIDERRDPIKSTIAASEHLKKLHRLFNESWLLALLAYNAGEGKIGRAVEKYQSENLWVLREGAYLRPETKDYFPKISALAIMAKNLKSFGFDDVKFDPILDFDEILLSPLTDLFTLSQNLKLPFKEIQFYNPEILRWLTPPDYDPYHIRVPKGFKQVYDKCCAKVSMVAKDFQKYKVEAKRTPLAVIAKRFKVSASVLAQINGISEKYVCRKGDLIYLPFREGQDHLHDEMYSDLTGVTKKKGRPKSKRYQQGRIHLSFQELQEKAPSTYHVQNGDTISLIVKKTGVSLDKLIKSNYHLLTKRNIQVGDQLILD